MTLSGYESIFIIKPGLEESKLKKIVNKFKSTVQAFCPEIPIKVEEWGEKKLAYPITGKDGTHYERGYYVLIDFIGTPENVEALQASLDRNCSVIKEICVKKDTVEVNEPESKPASKPAPTEHEAEAKIIDVFDMIYGKIE